MGNFAIRIEHGSRKGIKVSDGFSKEGARITTSANRCVLFNVLRNKLYLDFNNLVCADLCCGSGVVGFECLSLGAKKCLFVDCDKEKLKSINIAINKTGFCGETNYAYLPSWEHNERFDLIFFDPPYENNFCERMIKIIYEDNLLADNGILVVETKKDINVEKYNVLSINKLKNGAKFYFLSR